jgi:YD repeat-containing protein
MAIPGALSRAIAHVYRGDIPAYQMDPLRPGPAGSMDLGPGWTLAPDESVEVVPGGDGLVLHRADASPVRFHMDPDGMFRPSSAAGRAGWAGIERLPDGDLEAVDAGGTVHRFRTSREPGLHLLAELTDPQGDRLSFTRQDEILVRIETSQGDSIELLRELTPALGSARLSRPARIREIRASSGLSVGFRYDTRGRLERLVTADEVAFEVHYDRRGRLASILDTGRIPVVAVSYGKDGRVSEIRARGRRWSYAYDLPTGTTTVTGDDGGKVLRGHERPGIRRRSRPEIGVENLFEEREDPGGGCEDGYCGDASVPGEACWNHCGGGGGGASGGGGDEEDPPQACSFTVSALPAIAGIGQVVEFRLNNVSGCPPEADTSWITSPVGSPGTGTGSIFMSSWSTGGPKSVMATLGGSTRSMSVTVVPPCSMTPSGPTTPTAGSPVTYSVSSNCEEITWNTSPGGCPPSGSGHSFQTTFVQPGPVQVTSDGVNEVGTVTLAVLGVQVQACQVAITGPSTGLVGDLLCYQGSPTDAPSSLFTWSDSGGGTGSGETYCTAFPSAGPHSVDVSLTCPVQGCAAVDCGGTAHVVTIADPCQAGSAVGISAADPSFLIQGQTVTLSAAGQDACGSPTPGTYSWSTSDSSIITLSPSGPQVQVSATAPGTATLSVLFEAPTGTATDTISVTVVQVLLEQLDFKGVGNVDISIDGDTDIGSPLGSIEDVEWARGSREGASSSAPWTSSQAAPAAFIKGNPLQAEVVFAVQPASVSAITVSGMSASSYGSFPSVQVPVTGGTGTANVTSGSPGPGTVDLSDVTISWQLDSVTVGGVSVPISAPLTSTTNRIYTLYGQPLHPMSEPWATVLELSCGIAQGLTADVSIVEEMTRGIHHSEWLTFGSESRFLDPQARLIYNPEILRSMPMGPAIDAFAHQLYDLENFMVFLQEPEVLQQCNDNSNLLGGVFLGSLGIRMEPLWLAPNYNLWDSDPTNNGDPNNFLAQTTYFPAGVNTPQGPISFRFHQFGMYNALVYDPSTRPSVSGDPYMGLSFQEYLSQAFPGQGSYVSSLVATIDLGGVVGSPVEFHGISPGSVQVGSTTMRGIVKSCV